MPEDQTAPSSSVDLPTETKPPSLISQFVVFPLAIVVVGVSIYLFLGILTSEGRSGRDYLQTIKRGGINSRWQAAYELAKVLAVERQQGRLDPRFADDIVRLFEASKHDDPRVRRYLARAMEMVDDPKVVDALIGALEDADEETRLFAIHSLGSLRAAAAVGSLLPFAANSDPGFRKATIYALGQIDHLEVNSTLRRALRDDTPDVRWNAGLQLARRGVHPGSAVLMEMLDRPFLNRLEMSEEQRTTVMVYAIRAGAALGDTTLFDVVRALKEQDESLKVRQAAIEAMETLVQADDRSGN